MMRFQGFLSVQCLGIRVERCDQCAPLMCLDVPLYEAVRSGLFGRCACCAYSVLCARGQAVRGTTRALFCNVSTCLCTRRSAVDSLGGALCCAYSVFSARGGAHLGKLPAPSPTYFGVLLYEEVRSRLFGRCACRACSMLYVQCSMLSACP